MKKVICLIASIAFLANADAQYSSKRNVEDFNAIEVNSAAHVELVQSDSNYVTLASKDSTKKAPKMEVVGGALQINSSFRGKIIVHVKNIKSIKVDEAAKVTCIDTLRADDLTIHVLDAGTADIMVRAKTLNVRGSDAGYINLSGAADTLDVKATDASHIDAIDLKSLRVSASSADGALIDVWATNSIDAKATDGASIHIKGNPAQKNTSASDGGSVKMDDSGEETTPDYGIHNILNKDTNSDWNKKIAISGDAFIGGGFVTGGYNGLAIKYGTSREFMFGFGGGHWLTKWNEVGFDVYYKSTDFYLAQNSDKSFPDTIHHQAQKISVQNFGGLVFDRFYFGKHIFLDGGLYGDWTFHSKLVTWDNNITGVSSIKTIERNLSFVNAGNYGLTFRFGSTEGLSLYFNYRLSQLFQNSSAVTYPQLPAYTIGVNIGGF